MKEVPHLDPKTDAGNLDIDLPSLQRRIDSQVTVLQEAVKRLRSLQQMKLELEQEQDSLQFAS